ncbi:MAG: SDR family oxidoreductase [Acidimicrobiales bacterium]|nr:SDR family oxidoreductase [Acidimicrobiales bacterium]
MTQLENRVVLITGGNGGIGLGMATACAQAGARIVIWGRDGAKNDAAVKELRAGGHVADAFVCDVGDEEQVEAAMVGSIAAAGKVDAVFANAGTTGNGKSFLEVDLAEWHRVMRINLDGAFLTLQAGARHMVERGEGGALIAVSSTSTIHGAAGNDAYGASKSALLALTKSMAVGLARHQIRVNALVPGWTITDLARGGYESDKFREATVRRTPVRRWAEPTEMGPVAVYLADPTVTYHTGDTLVVDGGYTVF